MATRKLHYLSGLTITIFISLHLFNRFFSIYGAEMHIEMMHSLRLFYRNSLAEAILLVAVFIQIISGLKLFRTSRQTANTFYNKLHIWSGMYLAMFFIFHLTAVFVVTNTIRLRNDPFSLYFFYKQVFAKKRGA